MRLAVVGCGYVGLVTGACLAEAGHEVICTDIDEKRIAQLQAGGVPIYEQHLDQILVSARSAGKISYTSNAGEAIRSGEAIFICVEHFSMHLGQIILLAKLRAPGAVQFYEDAGGLARPVWKEKIQG